MSANCENPTSTDGESGFESSTSSDEEPCRESHASTAGKSRRKRHASIAGESHHVSCESGESSCGEDGEGVLPLLLIIGLIVLILLAIIGIFYSVLVAIMVGQRIWQRHYHILTKRMLTKEYVVEDFDGEGTDWNPPPLSPEHVQQLKELGLL